MLTETEREIEQKLRNVAELKTLEWETPASESERTAEFTLERMLLELKRHTRNDAHRGSYLILGYVANIFASALHEVGSEKPETRVANLWRGFLRLVDDCNRCWLPKEVLKVFSDYNLRPQRGRRVGCLPTHLPDFSNRTFPPKGKREKSEK